MAMIDIFPLHDISPSAYDVFVNAQKNANLYHTRAWLAVLQQSYGYQPASLVAQEEGQIRGVLPLMRVHGRLKGRRLVSLPFSHCVPILADSPAIETALLHTAAELTQADHYSYLELKTRQPIAHENFQPSTLNHISELDLSPSLDDLFAAFTTSNRRNIRKGEKAGFQIREGLSAANVQAFYDLEVATRMYQGSPVYPPQFFPTMAELCGEHLRLYMMSLDGHDVAGILMLNFGDWAIYGYGAWLRDEAKLYPMNALIWHAIQRAKEQGHRVFDFGTTPLHNEGLLEFKQRYNPALSDLPYWYFLHGREEVPMIKRDSGSVKFIEAVLRRLPRPLFVGLTPLLLREVG